MSLPGHPGRMKRWWYYAPWMLTNPLWPWLWRGGDEHGRRTIVIQPPLLGALVVPTGPPCAECAAGTDNCECA